MLSGSAWVLLDTRGQMCVYLVGELGHVVLQAVLVVRLLAHLDQHVEVAELLGQSGHPLVLTEFHWKTAEKKPFRTVTCSIRSQRRRSLSPQTPADCRLSGT